MVGLLVAGKKLRKRRFAGAILADDGVDLTGMEGEGDVNEDRGGAEGFAEGFGVEHAGSDLVVVARIDPQRPPWK